MDSSTAFAKNGVALNRIESESSVLIVRHTFDGLGDDKWPGIRGTTAKRESAA
tara:strand:+ start:513 stop:671 length:159 start_codon:yes stop_codon:yes gene_type:complete